MHILIGLITAIATLLFALDRMGVDIGWLNPWAWRRRRRWMKQLSANPCLNLDSPMEAAALLLLATARIDGDLSSEEKSGLRKLFEQEFNLSAENASSLLNSSSYLLQNGDPVFQQPGQVLERSLHKFSSEQKASFITMLESISVIGGQPSEAQKFFISKVKNVFQPESPSEGWQ